MRKPFEGNYFISQRFGVNPDVYGRFGLAGHNGQDYKIPAGVEILSPINGTVTEAWFDKDGYGYYVKIENEQWGVVLAHFLKILVENGAEVKEGDVVGLCDSTGFSTGNHLHFGLHPKPRDRNNGYNGYIDPLPILNQSEGGDDDMTPEQERELEDLRRDVNNLDTNKVPDLRNEDKRIHERIDKIEPKLESVLQDVEEIKSNTSGTHEVARNNSKQITELRKELSQSRKEIMKEVGAKIEEALKGGDVQHEPSDNCIRRFCNSISDWFSRSS